MMKDLIRLYEEGKELTLLEITYFVLAIVSFMVSGMIALFNQSLGISTLIVPFFALVVGVMNVVIWSIVKLLVGALKDKSQSSNEAKGKTSKTEKETRNSSKK